MKKSLKNLFESPPPFQKKKILDRSNDELQSAKIEQLAKINLK